ncbi:hypothetical protein JKF63_01657 [Porcisia hertigi]|uniref:Uncharacterized protein n=1 Tax=Porcisia hertigi TaxID=2761500 RepID=A0A836IEP5_9TRYP|nr:hypothetical protein JKF63_01657 [Porcisia hertigi]
MSSLNSSALFDAASVSSPKDARGATATVPKLSPAALWVLESGFLQRAKCAEAPVSVMQILSPPPSKRSRTSPTISAPGSYLCSMDAIVTIGSADDVRVSRESFGPSNERHRVSISIVTDTDIADECPSATTATDSSVCTSPHRALSCSAYLTVWGWRPSISCTTPTSLCAEVAHIDETESPDTVTAISRTTIMSSAHSTSSPRSLCRSL